MSGGDGGARTLEAFLAALLVDPAARARFRAAPTVEAQRAGLTQEECRAVCQLDLGDLELAARSVASKRAARRLAPAPPRPAWWQRLRARFRPAWAHSAAAPSAAAAVARSGASAEPITSRWVQRGRAPSRN